MTRAWTFESKWQTACVGNVRKGFLLLYSYNLWCVDTVNITTGHSCSISPPDGVLHYHPATSPQLSAFVLISQIVAVPGNARFIMLILQSHPEFSVIARIALAMYGIWNLDFFAHSSHTSVWK